MTDTSRDERALAERLLDRRYTGQEGMRSAAAAAITSLSEQVETLRKERDKYKSHCREWARETHKDLIEMESRAHRAERRLAEVRAETIEACAKIAEKVGNFRDYKREELSDDYGQPRFDMMTAIASAIRAHSDEARREHPMSRPVEVMARGIDLTAEERAFLLWNKMGGDEPLTEAQIVMGMSLRSRGLLTVRYADNYYFYLTPAGRALLSQDVKEG